MDAIDVARHYFDAWNRRDAGELVATFFVHLIIT